MNARQMQSIYPQRVQTVNRNNKSMYMTEQKGVKILRAFMQQIRIEMKRMVEITPFFFFFFFFLLLLFFLSL